MPDQSAEHSRLVNATLLHLGRRSDMLVTKRVVGVFRRLAGDPTVYHIGTPGEPDIQGVWLRLLKLDANGFSYSLIGQAIAIECKTGLGRLSQKQRAWRERFISCGGQYFVVRSDEDPQRIWPLTPR